MALVKRSANWYKGLKTKQKMVVSRGNPTRPCHTTVPITVDWRSTVVDRWLTGGPAVVDRWSGGGSAPLTVVGHCVRFGRFEVQVWQVRGILIGSGSKPIIGLAIEKLPEDTCMLRVVDRLNDRLSLAGTRKGIPKL
ncbi:hypothetical protein Tco_0417509 [Tanacetum coccineum]